MTPPEELLKLREENAELKAELQRLRASSFVTAVPSEHYERVIKAGDKLAGVIGLPVNDVQTNALVKAWNAAKEGKPSV